MGLGSDPLGYLGTPDATTTNKGKVRLATVSETTAGTRTDLACTPAGVAAVAIAGAPAASTTQAGIIEIATNAEAVAGTDTDLALVPSNLASVFAAPPATGATTPAPGTFTSLTTSGGTVSLGATSASNFTLTGAIDLTLATTGGSLVVNAGEAAADAIDLNAASGGLDVDVALLAAITSTRNNAQAILLEATAGGIDILASGAAAGEDIDIAATGSSVNITSSEAAADSIVLSSSAGGIDVLATGDLDVVATGGGLTLKSTENSADSVIIESTAGGIDILASGAAAGEDIDIVATGSSVNISSTENAALAITLNTNGGTSETIRIRNQQGTNAASVDISSTAGGLTLTGGLGTADAVNIVASAVAGGIDVDAGTAGFIVDTTGAISLDAAAASNFTATGAFDVTVSSTAGSINISGGEAAADAINIDAVAGGLDVDVALQMNLDSAQAAATAVRINASDAAGGIDVDAGTGGIAVDTTGAFSIDGAAASNVTTTGAGIDLTLSSVLGSVLVSSTEDAALAIRLHANGGTSETIQVHADQGTGVSSVGLLSDVGGITLRATGLASADAINLEAAAGGIDMDSALLTSITSTRDNAQAILLEATAGGIDILASGAAAGEDIDIIATGSSVNITSTEAVANAIVLSASNAAGGIDISTGGGSVDISSAGSVTMVAGTDSQAGDTCTINKNVFAATFTGFTTASAASQVFNVTNSVITATSQVILTLCNEGSNDAQMTIQRVKRASGTIAITAKNNGAAALNGNVTITGWVIG